jgi:vitamin B12 transporter
MVNTYSKATLAMANSLLFALFSTGLAAEEAIELDEMLVTARLQPISINDVASSVTVITREEIEQRQVKYLSDLLRDVPGFAVSQAGGAGSQTQVRVRGAEANQLLVLIDGVRANDPAVGDEFQYQFAVTSDIERIEIIRGPQSATWGSDAMAGVINIIRKKNVATQYLAAEAEGGSFSTINLAINGGYSGEIVRLNGGVSRLDTDGTNISRSGNEKDGAENTTASVALEIDAGESVVLGFSGQFVDASSDFDEIDFFVSGLPVDADRVAESEQTYLTGEVRFAPQDSIFSANFSVRDMDSEHDNYADGAWSGSTASETIDIRLRGGWGFGRNQLRNHSINFALERRDVDFSQRGEATIFGDPNQDQSYDVNGYALEYVGNPLSGFTWTLSGRLDDYSDFDDAKTWQLAGSYKVSGAVRLRGSVGTGSKAPTFTERYGFFAGQFIGNPDLKPESSQGWEIGVDTNWAEGNQTLLLTYFDQDLQDEIDGFVFDPDTFLFTALNKDGDSKRKGVEAVYDAWVGKTWSFGASYTYTDATEEDASGQPVQEVRRPKHLASLVASYYFANERGNLNVNLNYTGKQLDNFFSPVTYTVDKVEIPSYTVVDLAASWRLTGSLELTARASNLFDEEYEEILGFVRPGRAVYAGLRGRFGF